MGKETKNEPPRSVHAPEIPPLRRVTPEDVRKVEALLRQRRAL